MRVSSLGISSALMGVSAFGMREVRARGNHIETAVSDYRDPLARQKAEDKRARKNAKRLADSLR